MYFVLQSITHSSIWAVATFFPPFNLTCVCNKLTASHYWNGNPSIQSIKEKTNRLVEQMLSLIDSCS